MGTKTARTPTRNPSAGTSRAVVRNIEAGLSAECVGCGERIKFQAKVKAQQVICNVYIDGRWDRVEHFHHECYERTGEPHGHAAEDQPRRSRSA